MKKCRSLFLSNTNDVSTDYLINKFGNYSDQYLRINSEEINSTDIEFNPNKGLIISKNGNVYDLTQVTSVYFRRAPTTFASLDNPLEKPYLINERRHFFEGIYLSLDKCKWINPIFSTYAGERKLMQLHLAHKLKLKTPKTLVTNKRLKAIQFLKSNDSCIIKPISHGLQQRGESFYSIYTSAINIESFEELNLAETFDTPIFLQERINNSKDIRVTLVGDRIFSVSIEKNDTKEVDWRKPEINKTYCVCRLPKTVEKKLIQMNKILGLVYSAIDLIQTPKGEYIFLEVNPVGEWGWLELEVGLNISNAIINEILCRQ